MTSPLSADGVRDLLAAIEFHRRVKMQVSMILHTDLADEFARVVDVFYSRVQMPATPAALEPTEEEVSVSVSNRSIQTGD